jgi:hypothetical protein
MKKIALKYSKLVGAHPLFSNPIALSLGAALSFVLSLFFLKSALRHLPLLSCTFFWFAFRSFLNYPRGTKSKQLTLSTQNLLLHCIISFLAMGLYLCLFGALLPLPLTYVSSLYLIYPLYIPGVLRVWMGKKIDQRIAIGLIISLVGVCFCFNLKLGLNNIALILALSAGILKALFWVGAKRLKLTESPFTIWFYETLITLSGSSLLMLSGWKSMKWAYLLWVFLGACLEKLVFFLLSQKSNPLESKYLSKGGIFSLAIFIAMAFELIFNFSFPSFHILISSILIYLGLFITFFQKTTLPNPLYSL